MNFTVDTRRQSLLSGPIGSLDKIRISRFFKRVNDPLLSSVRERPYELDRTENRALCQPLVESAPRVFSSALTLSNITAFSCIQSVESRR